MDASDRSLPEISVVFGVSEPKCRQLVQIGILVRSDVRRACHDDIGHRFRNRVGQCIQPFDASIRTFVESGLLDGLDHRGNLLIECVENGNPFFGGIDLRFDGLREPSGNAFQNIRKRTKEKVSIFPLPRLGFNDAEQQFQFFCVIIVIPIMEAGRKIVNGNVGSISLTETSLDSGVQTLEFSDSVGVAFDFCNQHGNGIDVASPKVQPEATTLESCRSASTENVGDGLNVHSFLPSPRNGFDGYKRRELCWIGVNAVDQGFV